MCFFLPGVGGCLLVSGTAPPHRHTRRHTAATPAAAGPVGIHDDCFLELKLMGAPYFGHHWLELRTVKQMDKVGNDRFRVIYANLEMNDYKRLPGGKYLRIKIQNGERVFPLQREHDHFMRNGKEEPLLLVHSKPLPEFGRPVTVIGAVTRGQSARSLEPVHARPRNAALGTPSHGGCAWKVLAWLGIDVLPSETYANMLEVPAYLRKWKYLTRKAMTCDSYDPKAVEDGHRKLFALAKMVPTPLFVCCYHKTHAVGIAEGKIYDPATGKACTLSVKNLRAAAPSLSRVYSIVEGKRKKKRKRKKKNAVASVARARTA